MTETLKLMAVLAHPDDESLGNGGVLAKYAAEGVETYLVTATRGEQGWFGPPDENPGPEELGRIREGELRAAAKVLGLRDVRFLDYRDGELDQADSVEAVAQIVQHIREVRPHVVLTFDPHGLYGHPDHIAICQLATAAVAAAANPDYEGSDLPPHGVSKLYYMAWEPGDIQMYESRFGEFLMEVRGGERRSNAWQPWAITTRIDATAHWRQVWEAVSCHRTQLPEYGKLLDLSDEGHEELWGHMVYYRAFSTVNGGPEIETDMFEGLRAKVSA